MKINIVIGTKAELIKMVGIMKEFDKRKIKYNFIHTGQHTKSGMELINLFKLKNPDVWLTKRKEDLKTPLEAIFWAIKCVLKGRRLNVFNKGDLILVHGDTESTLIGTAIALLTRGKLCHIEGGLRSFDIFNPFPEEIIRRVCDRLSKYIFCTSEWSCSNLRKERIKSKFFNVEANTVEDTVKLSINSSFKNLPRGKFAILMMHRKETLYQKNMLEKGMQIIEEISKKIRVVFILSKNSEYILEKKGYLNKLKKNKNIILKDYYNYPQFMNLIKKCEFVAADSGGIQEETYYLNKPYLVLRKNTERKEGLGETAFMSNMELSLVKNFLKNYNSFKRKSILNKSSPSKKIVEEILNIKNEIKKS